MARSISSTAGAGLGAQREVALALDGERVALARLLVELHVARLALGGQQVGLGLQRRGLADVGDPLVLERLDLAEEELVERALAGRRRLLHRAPCAASAGGRPRRGACALAGRLLGRSLLGRRGLLRPRGLAGAFLAGAAFFAGAFLAGGPSWPGPSWPACLLRRAPSWPGPPSWPGAFLVGAMVSDAVLVAGLARACPPKGAACYPWPPGTTTSTTEVVQAVSSADLVARRRPPRSPRASRWRSSRRGPAGRRRRPGGCSRMRSVSSRPGSLRSVVHVVDQRRRRGPRGAARRRARCRARPTRRRRWPPPSPPSRVRSTSTSSGPRSWPGDAEPPAVELLELAGLERPCGSCRARRRGAGRAPAGSGRTRSSVASIGPNVDLLDAQLVGDLGGVAARRGRRPRPRGGAAAGGS